MHRCTKGWGWGCLVVYSIYVLVDSESTGVWDCGVGLCGCIQSNFVGSNIFGTMEISSRHG